LKAIISHDIDHITPWEHTRDLILPKFLARQTLEFGSGRISFSEYRAVFPELAHNKWQNIEELMAFDREKRIPATYFIGLNNGLGLSYSLNSAAFWSRRIIDMGFDLGVHGIHYLDLPGIQAEFQQFKQISGLDKFGIRTHYLRISSNTLELFEHAGYAFDSSIYQIAAPSRLEKLFEVPLHIMDGRMFFEKNGHFSLSLSKAQEKTKQIIDKVEGLSLPYLTLLFHDRYFCPAYDKWKKWYVWVIEYLQAAGIEFTSYQYAIDEL
jgi:hypothetical protein